MYLLPKIHKRLFDVPGRPVISNCGTTTEKVSEFLDHHLKPVMQSGRSYIKDTEDCLKRISALGPLPKNSILVTADVVGLYPTIPREGGLEALRERLNERPDKKVPTESLVEMAEFVLKNNYFEFNSQVKHQISGTAIWTKFAPPYACIFMDKVETEFLELESEKPFVWLRYIDDIFFIWTAGEEKLAGFLERLNKFHPNRKFTFESSSEKVNFLDVVIRKSGNELLSDLYCKPTDGHQYLHFESCHPIHMKRSSIHSQALRIKRLCSNKRDCDKHLKDLNKCFCNRGYPDTFVKTEIDKVRAKHREDLVKPRDKNNKEIGLPFVVTYTPDLQRLSSILRKHLLLLYQDTEIKKVFTPPPFVSYRCAFNLRNRLVRSKVYPIEREIDCRKCDKSRCKTCDNVIISDKFSSNITKEVFTINHRLNCDDKCLVYLLSCKVCGLQYVGQTSDRFRFRWNNYKACQRKAVKV